MRLADLFPERLEIPPPSAPLDGKAYPAHGAVYALTDAEDRFIQLAAGENLRRALLSRLQERDPDHKSPRADLRCVARNVWFIPTYSQFETMVQFHRCARELMPETYRDHVAFGPAWFVHVDPQAEHPRFVPTSSPYDRAGRVVGPFPRRAAATRFVEQLEDLFDLCRYHEVLRQAPHGEPCAYFEMGKCPAPCDGSISMRTYRASVSRAANFAAGGRAAFRESIEGRMRQAADTLAFEEAAALKQRLERVRRFDAREYELVMPLEKFNFLIIQRGGGRSRVKPFTLRNGRITAGEPIRAKQLDEIVPEWMEQARRGASDSDASGDLSYRAEQVWLVCHFLFKADRVPGLYLRSDRLPPAGELIERIREVFRLSAGRSKEEAEVTIDPKTANSKMSSTKLPGTAGQ